ncbi:hypothetical protein ACA910_002943 [Epithemia clementina (nom. ined.)]
MADDPNSSSALSPNYINITNDNNKNNEDDDKEKDDCVGTTIEEEKYSSVNEEEKNNNKTAAVILPPPAIPSPSKNPVSLVNSSAKVFNDEYDKSTTVLKCGKSSCKNSLYIRKCSAPQCGKLQCYHCIHMLYKKHHLPSLLLEDEKVDSTHNEEVPVCTKGCYNAVKKILDKGNDAQIPWNRDGRNGEDDPNNSDAIC